MKAVQYFCQAVLVLFARAAAFPLADLTGRAERLPAAAQSCAACAFLALEIQNTAAGLRNTQLCEYFSFCAGDWSSLLSYNFDLPQIRAQDRCLKMDFHRETCLKAIGSGLQKYQPFLLLVETSIASSNNQVTWMRSSTQRLAELVMNQINAEFGSTDLDESELEASASDLESSTDWNRQVKVHVILRDFTRFIEKTARAIRFMTAVSSP
ncbi:interleukin-6-like isoform X2 [Carcharodon carcharias]|uniref:interleukin-6-like isoform X2 n=1 Tax=Carcharodon carcharias TaxID=13397 RepID=UPI001B7F2902|nr:interleukin-6-like isoform X2 [Carcharodon carcharias]